MTNYKDMGTLRIDLTIRGVGFGVVMPAEETKDVGENLIEW